MISNSTDTFYVILKNYINVKLTSLQEVMQRLRLLSLIPAPKLAEMLMKTRLPLTSINTNKFTSGRNCLNVRSAIKVLLRRHASFDMNVPIQGRNYLNVTCATKVLLKGETSLDMSRDM